MKIYRPSDTCFDEMKRRMNRRALPEDSVRDTVNAIIQDVSARGDEALFDYASRFDKVHLDSSSLFVTEAELAEAEAMVEGSVKEAIAVSLANIHYFSDRSRRQDWSGVNAQGVEVAERFLPYDRVGIYIPGGKAPLVSTSIMTGGFAQAAGVREIVAATPCGPDGRVNPALLYALKASGATEIVKIGGAQAIAALALGTESVKPVEKIFGPGNRFVVEAKRQLVGAVAIDLLPGPSEVMVLADDTADAEFLAADLLAQGEHGPDSVVVFVTTSEALLEQVDAEVERQAALLSRGSIIREVLDKHAYGFLVSSIQEGVELVNAFAPEHLVLVTRDEEAVLNGIRTAGAIYAGSLSTVACGDFWRVPAIRCLPAAPASLFRLAGGPVPAPHQRGAHEPGCRAELRPVCGGVCPGGGAGRPQPLHSGSRRPREPVIPEFSSMLSMMQQQGIRERLPVAADLLVAGHGYMGVSRHHGGGVGAVAESMVVGLPTRLRDLSGWNAHRMGSFIHLLGNPA